MDPAAERLFALAAAATAAVDPLRFDLEFAGGFPNIESTLWRPPHRPFRVTSEDRHVRKNSKAKQATAIKAIPPNTPPAIAPEFDLEDEPELSIAEDEGEDDEDEGEGEGEDEDDNGGNPARQEVSVPLDTKNTGEKVMVDPIAPFMTYHPSGTVTGDQVYLPEAGSRLEATNALTPEVPAVWRRRI